MYEIAKPNEGSRITAAALQVELRTAGLRATPARVAVLEAVRRSPRPLSHAEMTDQLQGAGFSRVTIYRCLLNLTEAGLVRRTELGDRVWRFEDGAAPSAHPHFVCTDCGEVECLPEVQVSLSGAGPAALRDRSIEVQVRGRCDRCRQE